MQLFGASILLYVLEATRSMEELGSYFGDLGASSGFVFALLILFISAANAAMLRQFLRQSTAQSGRGTHLAIVLALHAKGS